MIEGMLQALPMMMDWQVWTTMLFGVIIGIIVGAIPGLTFTLGVVLLLPFSFGLPPLPALALLLGIYIGGMSAGSLTAVLIGIPGTPSSACTVFDGYPMAQNGQAGKALGVTIIYSIFGGLFSLLVLGAVAPQISRFALQFGPAEVFALVLFGFCTICSVSEGSVLKGLIAGTLGLLIMTIGLDPLMGVQRFTFNIVDLQSGIDMVPAMIGMFAIPQIIKEIRSLKQASDGTVIDSKVSAALPTIREVLSNVGNAVRSALIGVGVGAIPGTGGPIASFMAYDLEKRLAKDKSKFGKGDIRGVIAPEVANNAVTGGALIPLLTLGIPGDPTTAVILGGMLIHGIRPGPLLFTQGGNIAYGILLTVLLANLISLVIMLYGIRFFVRVLSIPKKYLIPAILVMTVVGSYAIKNTIFDVYVMAAFGVLAYLMERYGFPTVPVILALVLGPTIEGQARLALVMSEGDLSIFVSSPIAAGFLLLALLLVSWGPISMLLQKWMGKGEHASTSPGSFNDSVDGQTVT